MTTHADGSRPDEPDPARANAWDPPGEPPAGAGPWGPPPSPPPAGAERTPAGWGPPPAPPQPGYGPGAPQPGYGPSAPQPGYGPSAPQPGAPAPAGQAHGSPGQTHGQGPGYGQDYGQRYGQGPGYGQTYGYDQAYGQQYGQTYGRPGAVGQYGPAPQGYGAGYRPPAAQPGTIPLRPLGVFEILDGAFRAIRANPRVMLGLSAIVVIISTVVETLTIIVGFRRALGTVFLVDTATFDDLLSLTFDLFTVGLVTGLVTSMVTWLLIGLLALPVSRSVLGESPSLGEVWRRSAGQRWRLVGLTLLLFVLVAAPPVLWAGALALAVIADAPALAVLIGLVGGIAAVVAVVWLSVRTLLAAPVLMLERTGVLAALRRGWQLSRGSFWRLFGIALLAVVITATVTMLISAPFQTLTTLFTDRLLSQGLDTFLIVTMAVSSVGQVLAMTLVIPFMAAVGALLYVDVRMRKEGLDVELARAADQASA